MTWLHRFMALHYWYKTPTNDEDGSRLQIPISQTDRIHVLTLIGEGP